MRMNPPRWCVCTRHSSVLVVYFLTRGVLVVFRIWGGLLPYMAGGARLLTGQLLNRFTGGGPYSDLLPRRLNTVLQLSRR